MTKSVTKSVTKFVTESVTKSMTESVTESVTSPEKSVTQSVADQNRDRSLVAQQWDHAWPGLTVLVHANITAFKRTEKPHTDRGTSVESNVVMQ